MILGFAPHEIAGLSLVGAMLLLGIWMATHEQR